MARPEEHTRTVAETLANQRAGAERSTEATTKGAISFTEGELREIVASEIQRARGLKTVAEIKAGWKSRDEMEPKPQGKVSQQAARTPTLVERLARGLGLAAAKPSEPVKDHEPER
jgi:hypothetical protein